MDDTFSAALGAFIAELDYDRLPSLVTKEVKIRILDLIGVALAGLKLMVFPRVMTQYCTSMGGAEQASMLLTPGRYPARSAALANAACGHSLDMDDGHRFSGSHPATVVIPAALAAAEMCRADTQKFITGIAAGYEVMTRVGMAINPSSLQRGHHTTGTAGVFGAAAAAANIMGLSSTETGAALGLSGLQGAGLLEVNHDSRGAQAKPLNAAKAAEAGLLAAELASRGVCGPARIFEGRDGFLKAMSDDPHPGLLLENLGTRWEIRNSYVKMYAACRHCHAALDAALDMVRETGVAPDRIEKIEVETYSVAKRLVGIEKPDTPSAARFSMMYSLALALVYGDAGAERYCESALMDERVASLASKVRVRVTDRWEKAYPRERGAAVRIGTKDGEVATRETALARGEPENPVSEADVLEKFHRNANLALDDGTVEKLGRIISDLESHPLEQVTALLRGES